MEELKKQVRKDRKIIKKTVDLYKSKTNKAIKSKKHIKIKNRMSGNLAADILMLGVLAHSFKVLMIGI